MEQVGIRALKQNASAVVAAAAAGESFVVTDRGRPVAQLGPLPRTELAGMLERGEARPPRREVADLPQPVGGLALSSVLSAMRDDERV